MFGQPLADAETGKAVPSLSQVNLPPAAPRLQDLDFGYLSLRHLAGVIIKDDEIRIFPHLKRSNLVI